MLHLMQDQRRPIQGICYLDEAWHWMRATSAA